jgi:hypothetical protein
MSKGQKLTNEAKRIAAERYPDIEFEFTERSDEIEISGKRRDVGDGIKMQASMAASLRETGNPVAWSVVRVGDAIKSAIDQMRRPNDKRSK